jgi:hypothetical protein
VLPAVSAASWCWAPGKVSFAGKFVSFADMHVSPKPLQQFSVAYRSLFGESPAASLRRPPDDLRPQKNTASPWQLPESA